MKRWQKFLLALLVLLIVAQIPFAYRRYKLGKLHTAIAEINSTRHNPSDSDTVSEFVGVSHVHSHLGGHSPGTLQEIITAAQTNHLDFVLMTEHPSRELNTAAKTLHGPQGDVLFVNGNEVSSSTGERLLLFPGDELAASDNERSIEQILSRRTSGLSIVAYPNDFSSWNASGYQGLEIYNLFTNTKRINRLIMFFDGLWSYESYPELLFARFYARPDGALGKWDEEIRRTRQRLVGLAGNDAHANVGFKIGGMSVRLDPYERSFRLVRVHVLAATLHNARLTQEVLVTALKNGNCFIGFDVFGDTSGFRFHAQDKDEWKMMGDEITLDSELRLEVNSPVAGRIKLLRDGTVLRDDYNTHRLDLVVRERGTYRVEVYLPQLPIVGAQPWIISNPIYVR